MMPSWLTRSPSRKALGLIRLAAVALMLALQPALAVQPDEQLSDPKLEARARDISEGLRCLVCQNQSIDDSHAPLARDLRLLVRERLEAGDTNEQVVDYLVARYGDFILLKPPFKSDTLLLWATPLLVLVVGGVVASRRFRRPSKPSEGLSAEEERQLAEILRE
jgi:cytochrome c-type biogenesis protein CcmH